MRSRAVVVLAVLSMGVARQLLTQQRPPQPRNGSVEIVAAIVGDELQVRPVPLLMLEVWLQKDSSSKTSLRTGLDGHAVFTGTPGAYQLRSAKTPSVGGKTYVWLVGFEIASGKSTRVELTNANAQVDSAITAVRAPGREIAPEIALYERLKTGVLQVRADLASGTGFLLDTLDGIVLTNAHVVGNAENISVILQSGTRVPVRILAKSEQADVAVLQLPVGACTGCARLRMAQPDSIGMLVVPGERVVAVGFPLYQRSTVTSGIVSAIRERAIITDVNINEGNSGGPLVNMQGDVVGINTFGVPSSKGGPGLGGSILISQAESILESALKILPSQPAPELVALPLLSTDIYPLALLRASAESSLFEDYEKFDALRFGDFLISTSTTLSQVVAFREYEETIAGDRRKREARAGLSEEERFSQFGEFHDWIENVGDLLAPAVHIDVTPRAGETSGSAWGRALSAFAGTTADRAKLEFKGDVQAVRWYRNGEPLMPTIGGRTPQVAFENNSWVVMNDVAYRGIYVFRPEAFAPDSVGAPPSIVFQIDDLKHYDRFILRQLPADLVARIWNDFKPFYERVHPEKHFVTADPREFRDAFSALCKKSQLCSGYESLNRTLN